MTIEQRRAAVGWTVATVITVGLWVLIVWGFMFMLSTSEPTSVQPTVQPATVVQIQEDDPGWDCHTMGNLICGDQR